jgi:hypothetical protein
MRRVAHPYMAWEDYRAGMYDRDHLVPDGTDMAFELLTDVPLFTAAMTAMLTAWPTAAEHYLTRPGARSWAWLGAAACMHAHGVTEKYTRSAWWLMSQDQRDAANAAANLARA